MMAVMAKCGNRVNHTLFVNEVLYKEGVLFLLEEQPRQEGAEQGTPHRPRARVVWSVQGLLHQMRIREDKIHEFSKRHTHRSPTRR